MTHLTVKAKMPLLFACAGVLLLTAAIWMYRSPSLQPGDEGAAFAKLIEANLQDLENKEAIVLTATAPGNEVWNRIRDAWGDPGYIAAVLSPDRKTVRCFDGLGLDVQVIVGPNAIPTERATEPMYGYSTECQVNGIKFRPSPGDVMNVRITKQRADIPALGTIIVVPYWTPNVKDRIVGVDLARRLRTSIIIAGVVGVALLLLAVVLWVLGRQSAQPLPGGV